MKRKGATWGLALILSVGLSAQDRQEERKDPYRDWLEQDVVYIISAEERDVFEKLGTEEERQAFIEQFWRNRDPDPNTADNEAREEHYRRLAYANEKFAAGKAGWMTDRGMVYIKFGPPDRRQANPMGGRVFRSQRELAASDRANPKDGMTALPYEVWEYRFIEGVGAEVSFEFVAKHGMPDYKLVMSPEEKDALYFNTGSHLDKQVLRNYGLKTYGGTAMDRLEKLAAVTRPLPAQVPESFVSAQVHFDDLPFEVRLTPDVAAEETVLDLELSVPLQSLSFNRDFDDYQARVEVEIFVRDLRKIVVGHWADSLEARVPREEFSKAIGESSTYRTRLTLPPGRYLLEIWIKDVNGDAATFRREVAVIPKTDSDLDSP